MGLYDFFSRVLVPVRQRPSSTDLNRLQVYLEQNLRWALMGAVGSAGSMSQADSPLIQALSGFPAHGFLRDGFRCTTGPGALEVHLRAGVGMLTSGPVSATDVDSNSGADWDASTVIGAPAALSATQALTVPAVPAAGSSRIDIIEVRADYLAASPATVGILNTATRVFDTPTRNKRLHWDLLGRTGTVNAPAASTAPIGYVRGVAAVGAIGAATAPTVTSGYVQIARINLDNSGGALVAVDQSMIADFRPRVYAGGVLRASARVTVPGLAAAVASANNKVNSTDLPQGMSMLVAFQNNVAPAAGESYTAFFCIMDGGGVLPRTASPAGDVGLIGSAVATPVTNRRVISVSTPIVGGGPLFSGGVDTTIKAIFDGTDPNWTVLNGTTVDLPIGAPCVTFTARVEHPAGSALNNAESFALHFALGQG